MDPTVLTWILIVVGAVIVLAFLALAVSARQPADVRALSQAWREVAKRTRLTFTPPEGSLDTARLHGTHRSREVAVAIRLRMAYAAAGQQTHYYTRLEAAVNNPKRYFLRVNTKGAYRKTDQYLGQPVRPLGDTQVDARFDIKCIPHDLAERVITQTGPVRGDLLALHKDRYVEVELEGSATHMELAGLETNVEYLMALINLLCDIGDAFDRVGAH